MVAQVPQKPFRHVTLTLFAALHDVDAGFLRKLARQGRLLLPDGSCASFRAGPRAWMVHPAATWTLRPRGGKRPGAGRKALIPRNPPE